MHENVGSARVTRIDAIEPIAVAGGLYHPLRHVLGVRAFGINAYSARESGDQLIEEHDETGAGSGRHEEAYVLLSGGASFAIDGETIEVEPGTIVFVADVTVKRSAVATRPGTTMLVVGGPADKPLAVSPFEYWFLAERPYRNGDYALAIEIASEGLNEWPNHPVLHYQLACYHALAGDTDRAIQHLENAVAADGRTSGWARTDQDFDSLRDDPRFTAIIN